ncbi:MAG TPA: hypothetical protein VJL54_01990 [Nitrososphaera sp.]|nr:hypothetical protein [Nitrososphaera sp.]
MPAYSEPLCKKCLHPEGLHTDVVAKLPSGEIRRCTVAICQCLVTESA